MTWELQDCRATFWLEFGLTDSSLVQIQKSLDQDERGMTSNVL